MRLSLLAARFADKAHKTKYHKPSVAVSTALYTYPEGSASLLGLPLFDHSLTAFLFTAKDAFAEKFPNFRYTGTLRAVMPLVPVQKRHVPDSIEYPDYGREGESMFAELG